MVSIYLVSSLTTTALARRGCCSHHDGVCGCTCCDGTSLSSTCAPYYPSCDAPVNIPIQEPIYSPTPVQEPVTPDCPANSYYNYLSEQCVCNSGYAKEYGQCTKKTKAMREEEAIEYLHIPNPPQNKDVVKKPEIIPESKNLISSARTTRDASNTTNTIIGLGALAGAGYLLNKFNKKQ